MQLLANANFDFLAKRKVALIVSASLILIGIGSLIIHGGPNYGIDFLGGTEFVVAFDNPVSIGDVRSAVTSAGYPNAEIKTFGSPNDILIRVQAQQQGGEITDSIKAQFTSTFAQNPYTEEKTDVVGPKIGSELRTSMILAIFVALLGILLYVSWRFEFVFAVGAIAALFHDVVITLGIFSVLQLEITLAIIAAFLTIVGYSLNDTIVIFDRIRENLKVLRREKYDKIINTSINQSLSRTVVTSMTTMIVVLILFFFGGAVIHNFAFALIVGVIVGTYSSIFIASPIVVEWEKRRELKKARPHARHA